MMAEDRCIHDLPAATCGICNGGVRGRVSAPAADDHRGHPSEDELDRAAALRARLQYALDMAENAGIEDPVGFLLEMARLVATERGLGYWASQSNARLTVGRILRGYGAKHWSLDTLEAAVEAVIGGGA